MDEKLNAVHRVQAYIQNNLKNPITLAQLSKVANYSTFHTERLFKELVGYRLFEYIRKCRLTEAAKDLRDGEGKIIDTALDYMFDSHEGFTRSFSKQFGLSPLRYKKNPPPVKYFVPYKALGTEQFNLKKEDKDMETRTIFTQVVQRPKRKAIILRGEKADNYFEYCEEVGCDVWGVLSSVKEALFEPAGFWLPDCMIKQGTSKYVQGVEVPSDYSGEVPQGYELIELEPCQLMVFNSEPYDDENFMEEISQVWRAMEKYNPEVYGYEWNDSQPSFQLEPKGERGYIEARPVKNKQG